VPQELQGPQLMDHGLWDIMVIGADRLVNSIDATGFERPAARTIRAAAGSLTRYRDNAAHHWK